MPMTEKELLARDAKRDIGAELLQSARELKAGLGKVSYRIQVPAKVPTKKSAPPDWVAVVREMREK
jgi:putative transcriptional regulator